MTWTWLDVVVLLFCVVQIGLLIAVVVGLLRIKNGPLARLSARTATLEQKGRALAESGQHAALRNRDHILGIAASTRRIVETLRRDPTPQHGMLFSYGDMLRWLGTGRMVQSVVREARQKLRPAPPGPAGASGAPRSFRSRGATFAEKLGLVPPIVTRIAPIIRGGRIAWRAYQSARQQSPLRAPGMGRRSVEVDQE